MIEKKWQSWSNKANTFDEPSRSSEEDNKMCDQSAKHTGGSGARRDA